MNLSLGTFAGGSGYEAWAREVVPGTASLRAVFRAEPPDDFTAWIAQLRSQGVERIITGFLPDEVDCAGESWREDVEFFANHGEFLPFRLEATLTEPAEYVLHLVDGAATSPADAVSLTLAQTWAGLGRRRVRQVRLDDVDSPALAVMIAGAAGVVHDLEEWSVGFAVDELARRHGRPVIRTRNPGYSPVRYALLDMPVPPAFAPPGGHCRLRPLLHESGWLLGPPVPAASDQDMFSGAPAISRWRAIGGDGCLPQFWGSSLDRLAHIIRPRKREGWLHRPHAWAMLGRLVEGGEQAGISPGARERVVKTMSEWYFAEVRAGLKGLLRDRAAARFVRLHPEWIPVCQREAGSTRESPVRLAEWVEQGIRWRDCSTSIERFFACAWPVLLTSSGMLAQPRRWRDAWSDLADLPPTPIADRALRSLCVEACWQRLCEISPRGIPENADAVLASIEPWQASMGAAGPALRMVAALHCRRPSLARSALRSFAAACGTSHAWGLWRILRLTHVDADALHLRLKQLSAFDEVPIAASGWEYIRTWMAQRRWHLWRRHRGSALTAEVRAASDLMGALIARGLTQIAGQRIRLMALADEEVSPVLDAMGASGGDESLAGAVALAFWLRGKPACARSVLLAQPLRHVTPKVLFEHAVLWHLLDEPRQSVPLVEQLAALAPAFLREPDVRDGRFAWVALVAKSCGLRALTSRLRERALAVHHSSAALIDDETWGEQPWPPEWNQLLPEREAHLASGTREMA